MTDPISNEALAEIERLAMAATDGPWHDDGGEIITGEVSAGDEGNIVCRAPGWPESDIHWPDNRAYIAAAGPSVALALIAELRRARAALALTRAAYDTAAATGS